MVIQTLDSHSIIHYDRATRPRDCHNRAHLRALRLAGRRDRDS
jgi:hypothetical protein